MQCHSKIRKNPPQSPVLKVNTDPVRRASTYDINPILIPYGKRRRKLILEILSRQYGLAVNRKYCPDTEKDPDIKKLLKSGKISRVRIHTSRFCAITYIVLAKT